MMVSIGVVSGLEISFSWSWRLGDDYSKSKSSNVTLAQTGNAVSRRKQRPDLHERVTFKALFYSWLRLFAVAFFDFLYPIFPALQFPSVIYRVSVVFWFNNVTT